MRSSYGKALFIAMAQILSRPLLFRVATEPTAAEVARAIEILSQVLELPVAAPDPGRGAGAPGLVATGAPVSAPISVGGTSALDVDGIVEVYGLASVAAGAQVPGNLVAEGDLSTPLGTMEAPVVYLSETGASITAQLRSPAAGELAIGAGTGSAPDARIVVDLLSVQSISTSVFKGSSALAWTGNGGSGVTTVPLNGSNQLRLDSAGDACPAGSVATGLRLKKVDTNQAGVELECSD